MSDASSGNPSAAKRINPALVWISLSVVFIACFATIRMSSQNIAAGKVADLSWKVTDLKGRPVDLEMYRDKAVFLNVWATWCPPCLAEMPSIEKLAANPKLKNVAFLCVSQDEVLEEVLAHLKGRTPPTTILHASGPPPKVFQTEGIPATFIIAPGGEIVRAEVGSRDWDEPEIIDQLASLSKSTH